MPEETFFFDLNHEPRQNGVHVPSLLTHQHGVCNGIDKGELKEWEKQTLDDNREWWKHTVVYQIYPRSFQDSSGDGIGDLKGITSRLHYFKEIGIETIWISPFYKSPMEDFGYDISDFMDIDPIFGTMKDFEELAGATRFLDIRLIMDFVPNHTSDKHAWFEESEKSRDNKYADYFVWHDGNRSRPMWRNGEMIPGPPTNWLSVFGGSMWSWNEFRKQYYLHQFLPSQPDLNFRSPEVIKEIDEVLLFWLKKGADGFRMDAVKHLCEMEVPADPDAMWKADECMPHPNLSKGTNEMDYNYWKHDKTCNWPDTFRVLQHWRKVLDDFSVRTGTCHKLIMTEVADEVEEFIPYYRAGADFSYNFRLFGIDHRSNGLHINYLVRTFLEHCGRGVWPNWTIGNHDVRRVADRVGTQNITDAVNILNLLLPGTANVYYGEELGMRGIRIEFLEDVQDTFGKRDSIFWKTKTRDPARSPMQWTDEDFAGFSTRKPWLPVAEDYQSCNVKTQMDTPFSHLNLFKQLLTLRKDPVFRYGHFSTSLVSETMYSFFRTLDSEVFLVIIDARLIGDQEMVYDFSSKSLAEEAEIVVFSHSLHSRGSPIAQPGGRVSLNRIALQPSEACVVKVVSLSQS